MTDELPNYTQEEINQAREDLKSMTPEDLIVLRADLDRAIINTSMPEAVAICFTEVFTAKGNKINITCRGMTGRQAIDELADLMRYAKEKYNINPAHVAEPQHIPDEVVAQEAAVNVSYTQASYAGTPQPAQSNLLDIAVTSITRERKRDGKGDFLKVRGGFYTKYGVAAYDNVFPKTFDITKLQYGIEVSAPPEMANATVDTNKPGVHVVKFFA